MHDLKVSASTANILPPSTLFSQYLESASTKMVCRVNTVTKPLKGLPFLSHQFNNLMSAMRWRLKCKIVSVQLKYHTSNLTDVLTLSSNCQRIIYDTTVFLNTCKSNFEEKDLD